MRIQSETQTFTKRLKSMLKVDFKRMLCTPLIYVMAAVSFAMPVLILVMTSMVGGEEGMSFTNTWQIISALPNTQSGAGMELTAMCNMNMVYFLIGVFVCLFVGSEFRSGYAKNLFTTRAKKNDYVVSKTAVCCVAGVCMLISFFIGAMIGGAIASLPFTMNGFNGGNVIACLLAKLFLTAVFVPIFLAASVFAKAKVWLSILLSLAVGMLLFMMIPMMTPLDATYHFAFCLAGGAAFAFGLGAVSNIILNKTNIV